MSFYAFQRQMLPRQSRTLAVFAIGVLILSLNCARPSNKYLPAKEESDLDKTTKDSMEEADAKTFGLSTSDSPSLVLLNGDALEQQYLRVFGKNFPRGQNTGDSMLNATPDKFFNRDEHTALGTFFLRDADSLKRNTRSVKTLSSTYLRTIRFALTQACKKLVSTEASDVNRPENILIRKAIRPDLLPDLEVISRFMAIMFQMPYVPGQIIDGSVDYQEALKQNFQSYIAVPNNPQSGSSYWFVRENYEIMCVAIGQDPRVYSR